MSRKDPITGCTVMTLGEFWNSEAQHEGQGRSGADLADDFYNEMANEMEKERLSYFELPKAAEFFESLAKSAFDDSMDEKRTDEYPEPLEIIKVLEVQYESGFRRTTTMIIAQARRIDGTVGKLKGCTYQDSGTRLDPPDYDESIEWVKE